MGKGLESSASESKRLAYDLNKPVDDEILLECSICLEPVNENDERTPVTLRCEHRFHLDCIGSAFNAKNKMECPNCRNVEQGQWLYASDYPNADFYTDDWIPEEGQVIPEYPILDGYIHDWIPEEGQVVPEYENINDYHHWVLEERQDISESSLVSDEEEDDGVELDPFEGFHHHNPPEDDTHHWSPEGLLRSYFEYTVTLRPSSTATGDAESSNITNQWTTGSGEVINLNYLPVDPISHPSNPSDLIPLSPTPTNPRLSRSASEPDMARARLYSRHAFNPRSAVGGSRNSTAHVQVASQEYGGRSSEEEGSGESGGDGRNSYNGGSG